MKFIVLDKATGKRLTPDDKFRIGMYDEQKFMIQVSNSFFTRIQLDLFMNGTANDKEALVGTWILDPYQSYAPIERGTTNESEFTFKLDTADVNLASLIDTSEYKWGLISARFRDEYTEPQERPMSLGGGTALYSSRSSKGAFNGGNTFTKSGGIVGSGHSNQNFKTTSKITIYGDLDVIYAVRLVEKPKFSRLTPEAINDKPAPFHVYP